MAAGLHGTIGGTPVSPFAGGDRRSPGSGAGRRIGTPARWFTAPGIPVPPLRLPFSSLRITLPVTVIGNASRGGFPWDMNRLRDVP